MAEWETSAAAAAWIKNLPLRGPAKVVKDHLSNVDVWIKNRSRTVCPRQQCNELCCAFVSIFSQDSTVCNLPEATPKCIAICNFSGDHRMVYSDDTSLVWLLCMIGPDKSDEQTVRGVRTVVDHAEAHSTSLLLVLSMPWQSGVNLVHWELRTLVRRAVGDEKALVADGDCVFGRGFDAPKTTTHTVNLPPTFACSQWSKETFRNNFSASCLDRAMDVGDEPAEERLGKLQSILAATIDQRRELTQQIVLLKEEHRIAIQEAEQSARDRVFKLCDTARLKQEAAEAHVVEAEKQNKELRDREVQTQLENRKLKQQKAEAELLLEQRLSEQKETIAKLRSQLKLQENVARKEVEKLASFQASQSDAIASLERSHLRTTGEIERRMQECKMEERRAIERLAGKIEENKALEAMVDRKSGENQALCFEQKRLRAQAFVAVGLVKRLAARTRPRSAPAVEVCTTGAQTEWLKEDRELCEERAEVARLNDELSKTKEELERARAEAKRGARRRAPPPGCLPDDEAQGDAATEACVAAASSALRSLANLARSGSQARAQADAACARAATLEQMMHGAEYGWQNGWRQGWPPKHACSDKPVGSG